MPNGPCELLSSRCFYRLSVIFLHLNLLLHNKWLTQIVTVGMIHYSSFVIVNTFCLFKGVWRGIFYHVINEHEWLLLSSDGSFSCKHGPLSNDRDKGMLEGDSDPHVASRKIILEKIFLSKIHYYLNFRYVLVFN
jgi:hypothetical protein